MGVQERWRADAASHLRPAESIQAAFPAVASYPSPTLPALVIAGVRHAMRVLVVTNERILIFRVSWKSGTIEEFLTDRPRKTMIGPPHSRYMYYRTDALGERLWINRRWFTTVKTVDAALEEPTTPAAP